MELESFMDQVNNAINNNIQDNILDNYQDVRKSIVTNKDLTVDQKYRSLKDLQQALFGLPKYYADQCVLAIRRHDQEQDRMLGLDKDDLDRWRDEQASIKFDDSKSVQSLVRSIKQLNNIAETYNKTIIPLQYQKQFNNQYQEYTLPENIDKSIKSFVNKLIPDISAHTHDTEIGG